MKERVQTIWSAPFTLEQVVLNEDFRSGCSLGIDEAGRGPVLGPMVYSVCFCPLSSDATLKALGFADSKTLTEKQRDDLFDKIKARPEVFGYTIVALSPQHLSAAMLRRTKYNLNAISHDTAISLIQGVLVKGVKVSEVYIDTVGDPAKYEKKLRDIFPQIPKITVSKKADSLFPIVSAASICAKVTRDHILKNWVFGEKGFEKKSREFGSGYPGDPTTKGWLNKNMDPIFGYPGLIRFSWATTVKLLEDKGTKVDWPKELEEGEEGPKVMEDKTFFKDTALSRVRDL